MKIKTAVLQTKVFADKEKNIRQLEEILASGKTEGADLVTLPEMFACPYETGNFPLYAEAEGGPSWQALSALSKKYGIYLSAGSMPELVSAQKSGSCEGKDRVYNTAYVFGRDGRQIGKHRKAHLFDINVEGGQCFKESDTLSPGEKIGCFDTEFGRIGLCICYDFRFPETARLMAQDGAKVILVPAAFNMTTGPAHWELMFRQRAVESQCYVIGTAPARDPKVELDLDYVDKVRRELPLLAHRRTDLYQLRRL